MLYPNLCYNEACYKGTAFVLRWGWCRARDGVANHLTVMIRVINISFSIMTEFSIEIYTIRFISSINILRGERLFFKFLFGAFPIFFGFSISVTWQSS